MLKCLLLLIASLILSAFAQDIPPNKKWLTLKGEAPVVVARGGLSGVFPESSGFANQMTIVTGVKTTAIYCNLQLTKDGVGICLTDLRLQNSTNIEDIFPKAQKQYHVNGKLLKGWFSCDYESELLFDNVNLIQSMYSRPIVYDGVMPISAVEDVLGIKPNKFWLNAEYEAFYREHNLSVISYLQKAVRLMEINFLSSSEIGLMRALNAKGVVNRARTKLIFRFLEASEIEPTTQRTYGDLARDLALIRTFASGILVRKEYIWPIGKDKYLQPATGIVEAAHKLGMEVYASGFANDMMIGYNYSYDPIKEYLQFVDNGQFSVDGVLSDFSPSAIQAVECFTSVRTNGKRKPGDREVLVISSNGASGDLPPCTDLAYQRALDDGTDIIDCSVQLSKDGVAFCQDSVDLVTSTTAIISFASRTSTVPEIQPAPGIFSFDLTWAEILTLTPQISNPFLATSGILRNPADKNKGKFFTLAQFLDFAKAKSAAGVMINIQNARYLASKKGMDLLGAVVTGLRMAKLEKQRVFIRSEDTSVLSEFQNFPNYTRVLTVENKIGDAPSQPVHEIRNYAEAVAIPRASIVKITNYFTTGVTKVVQEMQAANLTVFVYVMRNEYVTLAFDYFSESTMEIATYVDSLQVDGIITEFPKSASRYITCPCRPTNMSAPYVVMPPEIGSLLDLVPPDVKPPADAPLPPLNMGDIVDPPLPPVAKNATKDDDDDDNDNGSSKARGPAATPSSATAIYNLPNLFISLLSLFALLLTCRSISHSAL